MKRTIIFCFALALSASAQAQHTFINNGPDVGIGTTAPLKRLHVTGGGGILVTDGPINAVTADGLPDLNVDNPPLSMLGTNGLLTNHGGLFYWRGFWGQSIDLRAGGIADPTRNIFRVRRYDGNASWTEMLKITENGNVGIGTAEPAEKLDVNGHIRMNGRLYWDWPERAIELYAPTPSEKVIRFRNSMTEASANERGGFDFAHFDGTSVMRIVDGKVGIGTTYPQSTLAVNGTITAMKVKVTTQGWADHVFQPGYRLRSLHELESFIKTNNHLPEIPTEKDVKANGADVGDIQAKLLQKIEELTLYIIDLDKKVAAQQQTISNQRKAIEALKKQGSNSHQ